jgi:hypothetical protein
MATNPQRTKWITDGALNIDSTAAQQTELAEAIYVPVGGKAFADLTALERAAIIPRYVRRHVLPQLDQLRRRKAAPTIVDPNTEYPE